MRGFTGALMVLAACGGDPQLSPLTATGGGGGEGGGGGGGGAACAPGSASEPDGSCRLAGVADCGEYFVPDDNDGCVARLPPSPCPPGRMAIPGEVQCRPVAECGEARYPPVPEGATVHHVDQAYLGDDSDGTSDKPWTTVWEAIEAAPSGAHIAIAAGIYDDGAYVNGKVLHLLGRCPDMVQISGDGVGVAFGAPGDGGAASGSSISQVAITSNDVGLIMSGVTDVVIDRVWLHEASQMGLLSGNHWGPVSYLVRDSLIEENGGFGLLGVDADITVERTVLRGHHPSTKSDGRGLAAENHDGVADQLRISQSLLEGNTTLGLGILGVSGTVEDVVVRDTQLGPAGGRGVVVQNNGATRATAYIRRVIAAGNHVVGMGIQSSSADVADVVIRDTQPDGNGNWGVGFHVQYDATTQDPAEATLATSLITRNREAGVAVLSSLAWLDGVVVRDVAQTLDGRLGVGISVFYDVGNTPDMVPPSDCVIRDSVIAGTHVAGVSAAARSLSIEGTSIDGVAPSAFGEFGDGVVLLGGIAEAHGVLVDSRIAGVARAGVANFGAVFDVGTTTFDCNEIDLDGEDFVEIDFSFDDLGGNVCGCGPQTQTCQVVSTNLKPPVATP